MPRLVKLLSLLLVIILTPSCTGLFDKVVTNDIDPTAGLDRDDFRALRAREAKEVKIKKANPAQPKAGYKKEQTKMQKALSKKISLTISEPAPVREVLTDLLNSASANVEISPQVSGTVMISAHQQPLEKVLSRICQLSNLRCSIEDNFIKIDPDEPYLKTYQLDYLSVIRNTTSETSVATNVFDAYATNNRSNNQSLDNNSVSKITGSSESNLWADIERTLKHILSLERVSEAAEKNQSHFSINKQAGLITVFGDSTKHQNVEKFLDELMPKVSAQVLIDARIIEVELDETYQAGINWSAALGSSINIAANYGGGVIGNTAGELLTAGVSTENLDALISLVEGFGTARVLSAPRLAVLNNQTALLKVATNQVYFTTQAQFTTTTNASGVAVVSTPVYTSTPNTVPIGFVMIVQPSINLENGLITMTIRPSVSRSVGEVEDPSIALNAATAGLTNKVKSPIPVLAVREMDSVIQLKSGEVAVMGGLMQDSSLNNELGVPGLSEVSIFGNLFKSRDNRAKTTELVILLKATITNHPSPPKADSELYDNYFNDARRLR
ncbi:MAG: secretin N-terminal domain-containing protein [Alphaproteobacteria bacterium]|nr:secretin N-terminal domain-containing protein [Alphaproteobacteria bacterium]MCL2505872.1 secretin N-terminal domain-containing protein [Alphaproteobacteria bacterium]